MTYLSRATRDRAPRTARRRVTLVSTAMLIALAAMAFVPGANANTADPISEVLKITAAATPAPTINDRLGETVDMIDDIVVAGQWRYNSTTNVDEGRVIVTKLSVAAGNTVTAGTTTILNNPAANAGDRFGFSLAVDGNATDGYTLVVGCPNDDTVGSNQGSAYVYTSTDGTTWSAPTTINAGTFAGNGDQFGFSVGIDIGAGTAADRIIAGAPLEDTDANNAGAAYIFTWTGTAWGTPVQILANDGGGSFAGINDRFGSGVAIDGPNAAAGAPRHENGTGTFDDDGAVYLYRLSGTSWGTPVQFISSSTTQNNQFLGERIALDGDTCLIGNRNYDDGTFNNIGQAFVLEYGTSWPTTATQTITAPSTLNGNDQFGRGVDLEGEVMIIGAAGRNRSYIYTDSNGSGTSAGWTEQSDFLFPTDGNGSYGFDVGISGSKCVSGAPTNNHNFGGGTGTVTNSGGAYVAGLLPCITTCPGNASYECGSTSGANGAEPTDQIVIESTAGRDLTIVVAVDGTPIDHSELSLVGGSSSYTTYTDNTTSGTLSGGSGSARNATLDFTHVFAYDPSGTNPDVFTVTIVIQDDCSLEDTCSYTVTVTDTTPPVITLTGANPLNVECNIDTYTDPGSTVTDNCDTGLTATVGGDTVDESTLGDYMVTYDVDDGTGNSATQVVRTVSVVDTTAPVIALVGSATITHECATPFTDPGTTLTEACDTGATVTVGGDTVDVNTLGSYVITYDSTDSSGNVAIQVTRTVTVVDTTPPVLAGCPTTGDAGITNIECQGPSGAVITYTDPTATDTCDPAPTVSCIPASGSFFPLGTTTVTCTATDSSGNTSTCTFDVTVVDTTAPTITCPANITGVECATPAGTPVVFTPTATDLCDGSPTITATPASGTIFPLGTTTVTCTATDSSGNTSAPCTFTVTVVDTTAPVLSLNGANPITLECGTQVYNELGATATDACDTAPVITIDNSAVVDAPGTYTVTYDAVDSSSNAATQITRTVIVQDTLPPTITLLGAATITLECAIDTFTDPGTTVTDACDTGLTATVGGATVDVNTPGTYLITYDVSDSSGNAAVQVSRTVIVQDTTAPVITLTGSSPVTVECAVGTYTEAGATVTDACDTGVTVVIGGDTVDPNTLGTYVVTYDATDSSGNAATQVTRTVNVVDTTAPIPSCPANITGVECTGTGGAAVSFTVTATDACDAAPTITCTPASGSTFPLGTTTVSCTATDSSGNTSSACTFTVTVVDTTPPTIALTGANPQIIECTTTATYTELGATATDLCDASPSLTIDASAVMPTVPGTYTVTYDSADSSGNNATQVTRTVIVQDTVAPTITCPANQTLECTGSGGATFVATYVTSDACDTSPTITVTPSGSTFPLGVTTVTATSTDASGNAATCTFTVTVQDTTPPTITLTGSSPVTVECVTGTYTELGATATDICDPSVTVVVGGDVVNTAVPGTYTVTYDATDASGNAATQVTRTVNVVDTTAPVITVTGATSLSLECGVDTYTELGATVFDACDAGVTAVIGGDTVDTTTLGTYIVTYNATDSSGNVATQVTRTIDVVDTTAPVLTLVGAASLTLECGVDTYTEPGATVFDACDTGVAVVIGGATVDATTPGTYVVTYDATDTAGNVATQLTRTVVVQDTIAPVITLTGANPQLLECGIDTYTELGATVFDACDATASVTIDASAVNAAIPGTYAVTYDSTDTSGNVATTVTRTVIVQDTTPPAITCPTPVAGVECTGSGGTIVTYPAPTAVDACDPTPTITCTPASGSAFPLGTTTVTCTATDSAGNAATCTFTVTVVDTTPPVITVTGATSLTLECGVDTYTELGATAVDTCDPSVGVTIGGATVDVNTLGTYVVTYDAVDASGNNAVQATRTVTVVDTTAPVITLTGPNTQLIECGIDPYTELGATVFDACDTGVSVVIDSSAVNVAVPGTYSVTYNATDSSGNAATTVSRTVVVQDTTPPSITCPANVTGVECTSAAGATVTFTAPTATDACDTSPTITCSPASGSVFPIGTSTVTCTATDSSGNAATCSFTVEVVDTTPPVITLIGAASITLECAVDNYVEQSASVSDNCDPSVAVVIDNSAVDTNTPGTYTVTYDATDSSGNVATQVTRTVIVQDTTAPVLTMIGASTITLECAVDTYTEQSASVFDACDTGVTVVIGGATVDVNTLGTYLVTYDATDSSGNTAIQLTRTVIVQDTTAPVITLTGANPQTLECAIDTYTELGATVTDACDTSVSVVIDASAVDVNTPGTYTVTYNATDSSGNDATEVTRSVVVQDTTAPVITLTGANPQVLECGIDTYTELGATVSDACDQNVSVVIDSSAVNVNALGTYTVTYDATDSSGNVATQVTRTVIVQDTTAPVITSSITRTLLWPANNAMLSPNLTASSLDACDGSITYTVTVYSDEANGTGTYSPDGSGTTNGTLKIRAERAYPGNGRFYLIVVTSTDASGNTGFACHSVVVPISPTTGSIVSVQSQAATGAANCTTNGGFPTGLNTIHTYTVTVP